MLTEEQKLTFKLNLEGSKVIIMIQGVIDEDAKFESLKTLEGPLVFNFSGVTHINSIGIRNWVNFMKTVTEKAFLTDCPPHIVKQFNMVPSFLGKASVLSVYVPFVCDECGHEKVVLVSRSEFFENPIFDDISKCDQCGKEEMAFDGTAEQYFAFAK